MISSTSSQLDRLKPPLPRTRCIRERFSSSVAIDPHASTGLAWVAMASRHRSNRAPLTYGYLTRIGLYTYQEADIPRWQPRGS